MRDHDDTPYIVIERHQGTLGAFVWGALIGAGAALLLAPRTGAQTQEELRHGVRRVRDAAEEKVDAARTTVSRTRERVEDSVGAVREQIGTIREKLETRADDARHALENSRRAAKEHIDRGVAGAKESYQAASDRMAAAADRADDAGRDVEIVITEITVEPNEGRPDLG